jgi:LysR family transcriptional regulator, hydrogen peroxide-inducible genes activator
VANEGGRGWAELPSRERLLLDGGHCLRDQAIAACGDTTTAARHATSLETLKYMVAAGEGCTLLPALAVRPVHGLQYVPLPRQKYHRTIVLAWRRSDPRIGEFEDLADYFSNFRHPDIEPSVHNSALVRSVMSS